MRSGTRLAGVALAALLAAAPLGAQEHAGAIGYGGGLISFGDFNDRGTALSLESGWLAAAQVEHFMLLRERVGFRAGAAFTQRPFRTPGDERSINTWLFDAGLVLRPLPAGRPRAAVPWLYLGGGVISYGFGEGRPVVFEESDAVYPGDTDRRATAVGALGVDVIPRFSLFDTPLGVRLEVADHVALESPFESRDGDAYGPVHNLRFTVGLIGLVDLP